MTAVRMVICDIDGTLVGHDKRVPPANIAAMRELAQRGVRVALISARPPAGIIPIAAQIGADGPFGAFNGGTIADRAGTTYAAHRVPDAVAGPAIAAVQAAGMTLWAFADGAWYASNITDPHTDRERLSAFLEPTVIADFARLSGRIDKLVAVSDDADAMLRLQSSVTDMAGGRASIALSQPYYLDVTALPANKGDGVVALAAMAGVDLAQVAVMGDQANDIPMFQRAGLSIAMGQADARVQGHADLVAATNDQAGVADAIHRFILPRLA